MLLVGTERGLHDLDASRTLVDGSGVTALAGGPGGWHALLDRRTVVRLDSAGPTTLGELPQPDGQSIAVLADGTVVVGRGGARLWMVGDTSGAIGAFELVPGRESWENPAAPTPDTRSMAVGSNQLWVNVHVGGLWSSNDRGVTWLAAVEPAADIHEVRTGPGDAVAVAAAVGFGSSLDGGRSWSWSTAGLHAGYLRALCLDGDVAFVSASDGPFTERGAVYRGVLGSGFTRCTSGLPQWFAGNVDTGRLDAAGGRVALGFGDQVFLSGDGGCSWRETDPLPDAVTAVRFAGL